MLEKILNTKITAHRSGVAVMLLLTKTQAAKEKKRGKEKEREIQPVSQPVSQSVSQSVNQLIELSVGCFVAAAGLAIKMSYT